MKEIRQVFHDLDYEILSMKEAGIELEVEETGSTFEENALLKAAAIAKQCDDIVLADDSGIKNRVFILPDIWDMILRMITRIKRYWKSLLMFRDSSVVQDSSVRLRQYFPMDIRL